MFPPYPREMKTNTAKFKSAANCSLLFSMEMVQLIPTRALSHARGLSMRTHLTAVRPQSWTMVLGQIGASMEVFHGSHLVWQKQ